MFSTQTYFLPHIRLNFSLKFSHEMSKSHTAKDFCRLVFSKQKTRLSGKVLSYNFKEQKSRIPTDHASLNIQGSEEILSNISKNYPSLA